ncbi:hypothetical protein GTP56_05920 [Duganella sp. FT134W]|uniref:Uncharacterized protein n=1 Tax=Duganella margarita TaxID=2692170 RepID=A0A7X4GZ78_9BURK|nr:DUF5908 family protein [Duganella margarita]MYM71734.1 hypothetical protein [Duganella margarita]
MAIEIRELVIKTTIVERSSDSPVAAAPQALKDEILAACRQLVLNLLRERRER